jgi:hypothetical protein
MKSQRKDPSLSAERARAVGEAVVYVSAGAFGLRQEFRARTVASMRASSNNRWSGP